MFLNRQHPVFDEALEILCMLSEWPRVRFLDDLRADMGYQLDGQVEEKLNELIVRGFKIKVSEVQIAELNDRRGQAAWIETEGTAEADSAAQDYFAKLYPASKE